MISLPILKSVLVIPNWTCKQVRQLDFALTKTLVGYHNVHLAFA